MEVYPLSHESHLPYILRVNQIDGHYPAHRHNFLEFSFITEGEGKEIINGQEHQLKYGTFTLLLPYQVHEIYANPQKPLKIYNCNLELEIFFGLGKISEELNEMIFNTKEDLPSQVQLKPEAAQKIEGIIGQMLAETKQPRLWNYLLFKVKLIELFIIFYRQRRRQLPNHQKSEKKSRGHILMWKIVFYLHQHYQENITLYNTAHRFGISYSHLSTIFKEYFGQTFHSFLNDIRIKHACALLSFTTMKIIDIANEVGFNSYPTFSRVFQQLKGISASEYRQQG